MRQGCRVDGAPTKAVPVTGGPACALTRERRAHVIDHPAPAPCGRPGGVRPRSGARRLAMPAALATVIAVAMAAPAAAASGDCTASAGTTTCTFTYTGSAQSWTPPSGVTSATFAAEGAQGGSSVYSAGGLGGKAVATLPVTPGATYQLNVGGAGVGMELGELSEPNPGGFNGGGAGGLGFAVGGGGGGASDVRTGAFGLSDRVLVAGGGGGVGYGWGLGGAGGGLTGDAGALKAGASVSAAQGGGGTQTAGGAGAAGQDADGLPGADGTFGAGGAGGNHVNEGMGGGGGGGGWYGGGGGGAYYGGTSGGGGGSGLGPSGTVFTAGVRAGDGQITVSYATPELVPLTVKNVVDAQIRATTGFEVLKSASTKAGWDEKDGSLRVDYRVEVRRTLARRGASFGQVQVTNPNGFEVSVSPSIAQPGATCDLVDDRGTPLSGPVSVAGNGGALFLFACSAPAVPSGSVTSTATVAWSVNGTAQSPVSDARALSWDGVQEVTEGPTSVKVTDTMSGKATKVLAEDLSEPAIFRYRTFIRPGQKCRTYKNTARLLEGSVLVPFGGSLTPLPEPKVLDEDFTTVRVCPPPKDDPSPKDPPLVVIDNGDGAKPVDPTPVDNPRGEVISDPKGGGAKLRVTKTASVKRAVKGSVVIWSITVKNTGTSDLDEVVIRDLLPKGLVAVTDVKAPLQKAKRGKKVVTFSAGDLLRGQEVTIRVATRATRTGRICNIAQAEAGNARSHRAIGCVRIGTPVKTG